MSKTDKKKWKKELIKRWNEEKEECKKPRKSRKAKTKAKVANRILTRSRKKNMSPSVHYSTWITPRKLNNPTVLHYEPSAYRRVFDCLIANQAMSPNLAKVFINAKSNAVGL